MVNKSTLSNGIRIVTEKIPAAHSVTLGFWVENGARHELPGVGGISHFTEHMLFKGTSRRSGIDIAREVDSVGGVLNGFTSREYSCYYAKVLSAKLPMAIDLLSDIVLNSVFDLDEIEKERRVILQEIYMLEDSPDEIVHDLFSQHFWMKHPLGNSVLGTRESVANINRDTILEFLSARYCGKNIIIAAAGDLEHESLVEAIEKAFGAVPSGVANRNDTDVQYRRQINVVEKELEQVHICLGTRGLSQSHPKRFESYLMNTVLGSSMSSRLFQKVREDRGLAYSIYSYLDYYSDAGSLVVYSGTSPDDAPEVIGLVLEEFKRLKREPVSAQELHDSKEQLKGHLLLSLESTDSRMTRLAKNEIYLGSNTPIPQVLKSFDAVTAEQVQSLANELFQDDYLNLQLLGNVHSKDFPLVDLTLI